jgi:antitoxin (DNA-binding transcriptional repressor) of toxin-antitoxin stability system
VKSVKLSDVRGSLSEYARKGLRETVVVTRQGRPVMAVMPLTKHDDWESVFLSTNARFLEIIERSRESARDRGCIPLEEVRRKHGLQPKVRRRRSR